MQSSKYLEKDSKLNLIPMYETERNRMIAE
jgi:hypothetical protein